LRPPFALASGRIYSTSCTFFIYLAFFWFAPHTKELGNISFTFVPAAVILEKQNEAKPRRLERLVKYKRRRIMATESFGKIVYLTNDMADRIIAAQERMEKSPPPPSTHEIKWGDSEKVSKALRKEYEHAE
jgi:hypothetical protein